MAGPGLGRGQGRPHRVVYWGTYDVGKPRNRIMLRDSGVAVTECHVELWRRVEDKSQLTGPLRRAAVVARWLVSYPVLIARYLLAPAHDAVVVGYVGHVDVLVLWPCARLRRAPIVWDAFLSLYDTAGCDRRLVSPRHPVARALFRLEALACRLADRVVLDTRAHADYFQRTFHVPAERLAVVPVGAEGERFPRRSVETIAAPAAPAMTVLFYGQFIPLHGIEAIIRAADLARDDAIDWVLIGRGQEAVRIRRLLAARPIPRLRLAGVAGLRRACQRNPPGRHLPRHLRRHRQGRPGHSEQGLPGARHRHAARHPRFTGDPGAAQSRHARYLAGAAGGPGRPVGGAQGIRHGTTATSRAALVRGAAGHDHTAPRRASTHRHHRRSRRWPGAFASAGRNGRDHP